MAALCPVAVRVARASARRNMSAVSNYLVNKARENVVSNFTASSVLIPSVDGEDWLLNRFGRAHSCPPPGTA